MSRSRKRVPVSTCVCCKSQKKGKMLASKRFRRLVKSLLSQGDEMLPMKSRDLTSPYDLGGDGKKYWHIHSDKLLRK